MGVLLAAGCAGGSSGDGEAGSTSNSPATSEATSTSTVGGSAGCRGEVVAQPGTERLSVPSRAGEREVERVIPSDYDGTAPHPVILSLHGFTSSIDQIDLFSDLPKVADGRGYILLTPQAMSARVPIGEESIEAPFWNILAVDAEPIPGAVDDVGFLSGLIEDTRSELCVDPDRIFATGNSNGAGMAALLACQIGHELAAIAPVSGINLAPDCEDPVPVSVIAFHGDADPLVEYEGGSANSTLGVDNPSVEERVGDFAAAADCESEPEVTSPFDDIRTRRWPGCAGGIDVELHTVVGGGHTWPGMLDYVDAARLAELGGNQQLAEVRDLDLLEIAGNMTTSIEATELMVDFFDTHPR